GPAKQVDPVIGSVEKFGASVDALLDNLAAGQAPDHTFVFDVSQLYVALACTPDKIEAVISRPLETVFTTKAAAALTKNAKLQSDTLVKSLMDKIQLVILTKQKDVDVLLVPPFFKALTDEERRKNTPEENALRDGVDMNEREQFVKFGSHDSKKLDSTMISSGARIDPIAAKRAMLDLVTPERLLASSGLKEGTLGTKGKRDFVVCESFQKLTETGIFQKFRNLASEQDGAPYLKIYPSATADLLAGLASVKTADGTIDDIFAAREITEVLQTAYYRMMNAMGGAIGSKADIIAFMNQIEVIHDQMQMILAIAEPYAPGVAFAKGIIASLKTASKGQAPVVPEGLDPKVSHKASAMHSVASIMSGVEAQKEADEGNRNVNALVLRDNYYESAGALHNTKTYDVTALDGDQLRGDKKEERKDLTAKALVSPGALSDGKVEPKAPRGPVDLFVCDFHHNISMDRTLYQVEDVEHQVAQLFEQKLVAPKFTVAIDCTVDLVRSDDIRKFLARFKKQISDGNMSVVLFRSAQKFDMLGMDNYYGGYTVTINNGSSFDAFNERISKKEDQVGGLAHQGMAHMAQHGTEHTDEYRRLLMANTRLLYSQLPDECRLTADNDSPLQIAQTDDPNNVFLDIQFPGYSETFGFYNTFIAWAQGNGLGFTTRPSFGFATSNFTIIGDSKLRLNPGLESAAAIGKYVGFFTQIQAILAKTQASQLAGRKRSELDKSEIPAMEAAFKSAITSWSVQESSTRGKDKASGSTTPVSGPPIKESAKRPEPSSEPPVTKGARPRRQLGSAGGTHQL
nr:hypothetical protein [Deltaproteobacteria bacterium]